MNLPTPPTDNLYKFWAIGGLVAAFALLFWIDGKSVKLEQELFQTELAKARLEVQVDALNEDVRIFRAEQSAKTMSPSESKAAVNKLASKLVEARLQVAELEANSRRAERLSSKLERNSNWAIWVSALYALIAVINLREWYAKSQRHQDELLRLQVESARHSLAQAMKGEAPVKDGKKSP